MELTERAIQLLAPILNADPDNIGIRHDMARIKSEMGWWLVWDGQTQEGLNLLEGATPELEYVSANLPKLLDAQHHLWRAYSYQVDGLKFTGRNSEALRLLEDKALPLLLSSLRRYPNHPLLLFDLHEAYLFLGEKRTTNLAIRIS
ncbi:MAG: tetratricopeptide (TPR) repeat protein [Rhodothermales bacterium]|jgi:tetratricopeptide (TPR) repeat protein